MSVTTKRITWIFALILLPSVAAKACAVNTSGVVFGSYDPFAQIDKETVGTLSVICPEPTVYTLTLSAGFSGFNPRQLQETDTNTKLQYNLFTDSTFQSIWGDGTNGTQTVSGNADGTGMDHSIYGRIPASQNVPAGDYTDTIILTVEY